MTLTELTNFLNATATKGYTLVDPLPNYTRKTPIQFECNKHGRFSRIYNHLANVKSGIICPKCSAEERGETRDTAHLIEKIEAKFGKGYFDLAQVEYRGYRTKIRVGCQTHGWFDTTADKITNVHQRNDCPQCAQSSRARSATLPLDDFIAKARAAHGERYDYSLSTDFAGYKRPVTVVCVQHGPFKIHAGNHLTKGQGCQKCGCIRSKGEREMAEWIGSLGVNHIVSYRNKLELDIFIPERQIGIEYCGLYWHSEARREKMYHQEKRQHFARLGIRVIHVYEDEWRDRQDVVKQYLLYQLQPSTERFYARQCRLIDVPSAAARRLLDARHLQGASLAQRYIGLQAGERLVAVGAFTQAGSNRGTDHWELIRYVTDSCAVVGGLGRIMTAFHREVQAPIFSYTDLDKFTGDGYEAAGFTRVAVVAPDYRTVWNSEAGKTRRAKQYTRRANLARLAGFQFDPALTEHQNCLNNGVLRVYDGGKIKWVWGLTQ